MLKSREPGWGDAVWEHVSEPQMARRKYYTNVHFVFLPCMIPVVEYKVAYLISNMIASVFGWCHLQEVFGIADPSPTS